MSGYALFMEFRGLLVIKKSGLPQKTYATNWQKKILVLTFLKSFKKCWLKKWEKMAWHIDVWTTITMIKEGLVLNAHNALCVCKSWLKYKKRVSQTILQLFKTLLFLIWNSFSFQSVSIQRIKNLNHAW